MRYSITTCICTCITQIRLDLNNKKSNQIQTIQGQGSADFQLHSFLSDVTLPATDDKNQKATKTEPV
jgi:DNA-binding winged helix-turn-helix (wHTH) protein